MDSDKGRRLTRSDIGAALYVDRPAPENGNSGGNGSWPFNGIDAVMKRLCQRPTSGKRRRSARRRCDERPIASKVPRDQHQDSALAWEGLSAAHNKGEILVVGSLSYMA
ncbi:uncharacterized protein CIMG_12391 [Coccidioides immitis RS]|uniref:Uncharacterized protein n=3 Tax=Coccidioides immitis TaxID=5501 RepID=A0A0D8JT26_COCIM|nr:uncharacterized protein CIMG_12391 [Coccidioides immitis RS]KJF60447.1 hypothetical protein CIMG_12391 [Coccidioides immitis RS]KMP02793.1 hypothetical protein CIRG_02485 [Coccidioides immitis RMSCC 2394]KMU92112.1 hypothetical protein CIHG_09866 [Coccidioides immitis H538.4]